MIGNVTNPPNGYLKAISTNTYFAPGAVNFDVLYQNTSTIGGLYKHSDIGQTNPLQILLPNTVKKVLLRVFALEGAPPVKFVAHANLEGVLYGSPSFNPRLFLIDGDEIEIYGLPQIKRIRLMDDNVTNAPYLVSISMFN